MIRWIAYTIALIFLFSTGVFVSYASTTDGTIDPSNTGNYQAKFYDDTGYGGTAPQINFGKFTSQSAYNISITDNGLSGYAWGELAGWIVMNCVNTSNGCTSTNGNFKVGVATNGTLSGYAWGENTGWVNFGPFANSGISQVKIGSDGKFGGTLGSAGYAWSQSFGWIVFDCSSVSSCVATDYRPANSRTVTGGGGGGGSGYIPTICMDGRDNDGDGKIDLSDPGCADYYDQDEYDAAATPPLVAPDPVAPPPNVPRPTTPPTTGRPSTSSSESYNPFPDFFSDYSTPIFYPPAVVEQRNEIREDLFQKNTLPAPHAKTEVKGAFIQVVEEFLAFFRESMHSIGAFLGTQIGHFLVIILVLGLIFFWKKGNSN